MAQTDETRAGNALQAALLACSMMYIRVLVLIWLINGSFMNALWYRLVFLCIVCVLLSFHKSGKEIGQWYNRNTRIAESI